MLGLIKDRKYKTDIFLKYPSSPFLKCFMQWSFEVGSSLKPFNLSLKHLDSLSGDLIVFVSDLIDSASESVS